MEYDNAATRLYKIMSKLANEVKHDHTELSLAVWRRFFSSYNTTNDLEIYGLVAKVILLPNEALQELKDQPDAIYAASATAIHNIGNALAHMQIMGPVNLFCNRFDNADLNSLLLSSAIIGNTNKIKFLQESELTQLRSQFQRLEQELQSADIDKHLKVLLLGYVRQILQAIDTYELTGIKPLVNSVEAAYGHVVIDEQYRDFLRENSVGQTFANSLQTACTVISTIADAPQAIAAMATALAMLKSFSA